MIRVTATTNGDAKAEPLGPRYESMLHHTAEIEQMVREARKEVELMKCGHVTDKTPIFSSADVLRDFNAWRRNENDYVEPPHPAKRIGEAIDEAVEALKERDLATVGCSKSHTVVPTSVVKDVMDILHAEAVVYGDLLAASSNMMNERTLHHVQTKREHLLSLVQQLLLAQP